MYWHVVAVGRVQIMEHMMEFLFPENTVLIEIVFVENGIELNFEFCFVHTGFFVASQMSAWAE